jgi:hypothetical protein
MNVRQAGTLLAITVIAASGLVASSAPADAAGLWRNCTSVNHRYHHGVGRAHAHDHVTSGKPVTNFRHSNLLYRRAMAHNKGLDRDHDRIACEKH